MTTKVPIVPLLVRWTEEDQQIWRDRQMKPHTILYRYQHHIKESNIMLSLMQIPIKPSRAKLVALQFMN